MLSEIWYRQQADCPDCHQRRLWKVQAWSLIESQGRVHDGQMPKRELPILVHGGDAERLSAEFDYDDMVALSGLFRVWAVYSATLSPEDRTELIGYFADFEEVAHWAGEGWRASDPSLDMPVHKFLASRARNRSSVVRLEHAKYWLGRS